MQVPKDVPVSGSLSEKVRLSSYEVLMKRILFACERCDGALIQVAMCRFCKTTSLRRCKDCKLEVSAVHRHCIPNSSEFFAREFVRLGVKYND